MKKRLIYMAALLSLCMMMLSSCRQEATVENIGQELIEPLGGLEGASAEVSLDINFDFGSIGSTTKADSWPEEEVSRKVSSMLIICRPYFERSDGTTAAQLEQMEKESWSKARLYPVSARPDNTGKLFNLRLKVPAGEENNRVRFYILLNGSHHMIEAIEGRGMTHGLRINRESVYTAQSVRDIDFEVTPESFGELTASVINEFVSAEGGFTMMGICKEKESTQLFVQISQYVENTANLQVVMHRMVSRVLLTSQCYPAGNGEPKYLKISGFEDYSTSGALLPNGDAFLDIDTTQASQAGWMPLESVHYCLNAVNTKVYLEHSEEQVGNTSVYPEDPNYMLDDILQRQGNDWVFKTNSNMDPLYNYSNDFIYLQQADTEEMFALYHDKPQPSWMKTALEYNEGRNYFTSTAFSDGLYCLENTTSSRELMSESNVPLASSLRKFVPKRATTHILIEGRFIPRYVVTGRTGQNEDSRQTIIRAETIGTAEGVLVNATYGNGTFWTPDLTTFYNQAGMLAEIEYSKSSYAISQGIAPLSEEDFVCYKGGWCTYSSYIAGKPVEIEDGHGKKTTTYADGLSSVRRDGYYILTTASVRVPSIESTMMEVNTTSGIRWADEGTGTVTIKP